MRFSCSVPDPPFLFLSLLIYRSFFPFFLIHVWAWHSTLLFSWLHRPLLYLPFLAGKLLTHCSGLTPHINAARRLAGRHLMQRWQPFPPPDICHVLLLLFVWYFPLYSVIGFVLCVVLNDWQVHQTPRTKVPRWPSSSDAAQFPTNVLHLSSDGNLAHSSAGSPWMFVSPHMGYWAGPFFLLNGSAGQNWPTQHLFLMIYLYYQIKTPWITSMNSILFTNYASRIMRGTLSDPRAPFRCRGPWAMVHHSRLFCSVLTY